jgi:membrane protease YdiL (CAAX protease family)
VIAARLILAAAPIVGFAIGVEALAAALALGTVGPLLLRAAGALALYVGYVRLIEQRRVDELGRRGAGKELACGLLLGCSLFAATFGVIYLVGGATVAGNDSGAAPQVIAAGLAAMATAITEEILIRAILFRILERSLGTRIALLISAAAFGLGHAFNPGATAASTAAIAVEAGVLLAAALIVTRRLWLAFGLHAAWNFTEGGVFGATVSGHAQSGLLISRFHGDALITGGTYGPEASIVAVALCLATAGVLLLAAHRRGHVVSRAGALGARVAEPREEPAADRGDHCPVAGHALREDDPDNLLAGRKLDVGGVMTDLCGPTRLRPQLRAARQGLAGERRPLVVEIGGRGGEVA